MKKVSYILIFLILMGCEDPIQIDLPTNEELVVVQGWVSNQLIHHEVTLTRTQGFNDQTSPLFVNGANVTVYSNQNEAFRYEQAPDGVYRSVEAFAGMDSVFYQLEVVLPEGDTINSPFELMPRLVPIDSIAFDTDEELSDENGSLLETFTFPVCFAQDPPDIRNYYRWKISRNDTLFNSPNDLELLDDSAINGNFFPNEFRSFRFEFADTAQIEMQTISRDAFEFLSLLKNQTTLLGTSSGTLPATISGNLRNRTHPNQVVLGFFGSFSSSTVESVLLEE